MNQYNDLRMMDRSTLASAQEAFLRSGGKIDELPSFEFKPLPPRIEPQLTPGEIELRRLRDRILELSPEMNKEDVAKQLGIGYDRMTRICKMFNINLLQFRRKRTANASSYATSPEEDSILVKRIKALAEVGLTRRDAAAQVRIGYSRLSRLIRDHGIEFKAYKRCE